MARAHRRDGGDGATRHSPSSPGTRPRSRVKAIDSAVRAPASRRTPPARPQPPAGLVQDGPEPVPLGVGPLLQPAQVDLHGLAGAEQPLQRPPAQRRLGVAVGGGRLQVGDQPLVGLDGPLDHRVGLLDVEVGGQALGGGQEGLGDRGRDPVEGGHGGPDRVRPGGQVAPAGLGPLGGRGVLAVVAGHVQGGHVVQRVGPVQLQLAQLQAGQPLEGGQLGLVVRVVLGWPAEPGQGRPDTLRGEVLDPAVVLVAADVLADRAHRQVTERPQSLVHDRRAYGGPPGSSSFPRAVRVARGV
jgi:hypothetical protein